MLCTSFAHLKEEVERLDVQCRMDVNFKSLNINCASTDNLSVTLYLPDAPTGCTPLSIYGDGNCFTRSISLLVYGTQDKHLEIRAKLCAEAVLNAQHYLDNDYLNLEGKYNANLPEYFAIVSEKYNEFCNLDWNSNTIELIYRAEALALAKPGQYCSMWQLYQASNVIGRPIFSIFPSGMIDAYRSRSHRIVYPITYCLRQNDPVCIMWTKISKTSRAPNHFVPVVTM